MGLKQLYEFAEKMRKLREGKPEFYIDKRPDAWSAHRAKQKDKRSNRKPDKRIM